MTSFAARFRRGDQLLGGLMRMPNEGLVQLAGLAGLDFVVIDTEHGPADQLALVHHLNAAAAHGMAVIVRIGTAAETLRVLDLGAHGILAPHVTSVMQARELVDAAHYPPLGRRGFAGNTRAARYGLRSAIEHYEAARESIVIAMIEDPAGLAAAPDIATLPGIDALMFGPADYATELGVVGRPDPRVHEAAGAVRDCARAAGAVPVSIVSSVAAAREAFDAGDTAVMYNIQQALDGLFTGLAAARPDRQSAGTAAPRREPLLLLPGMLGDATVWEAVASRLVDVAMPQFGRIDLDDSIAEMAASVLAVAPERFALAGHSPGAIVALEIVRRAPERVLRVALVNASGRGPSPEQHASWTAITERLDHGDFGEVACELARSTLPAARQGDDALVAANEKMAWTAGLDGLGRQLRAQQGRTSYLDEVGAISVPVLIVSGALDDICPPARQEELLTHCPQARLVSLSDAGHMTPLEQPAGLAAELRTWLTGGWPSGQSGQGVVGN